MHRGKDVRLVRARGLSVYDNGNMAYECRAHFTHDCYADIFHITIFLNLVRS